MALARIGIGSNLGDPVSNVKRALDALSAVGSVVARSHLYRTPPWGDLEQPDFVNAAALVDTELEPRALLAALKQIETALGRRPARRWGPRAIDLDILAYDDLELVEPGLAIPHPGLLERVFALGPLAEIDPSYRAAFEDLSPEARSQLRLVETEPAG
jgi:2-amino-4-hydroxy-6-hydroxymethyldihydropteridine diphosphokinase